jgi:FKBP-type peptidyl-prolyl cis-trans isomerase SlyD
MSENQSAVVANDMVVSMDYTLTVNGELLESSMDSGPLEYLHGHNNLIPGLENALIGMLVGESKDVLVAPKDAYGEIDPDAFVDIDRSQFPEDFPLEIGRSLRVRSGDGRAMMAAIFEIGDTSVRLDLNHPLAGKDLLFNAKIVGLRSASEDELNNGRIGGCDSCGSGDCSSGDCGSGGCGSGCC